MPDDKERERLKANAAKWRGKCRNAEYELEKLKKHTPPDKHEATIKYCLETAELMLNAAKSLCDMRLGEPVPELDPTDEPAPATPPHVGPLAG